MMRTIRYNAKMTTQIFSAMVNPTPFEIGKTGVLVLEIRTQ